jgi:hypothetical protein
MALIKINTKKFFLFAAAAAKICQHILILEGLTIIMGTSHEDLPT